MNTNDKECFKIKRDSDLHKWKEQDYLKVVRALEKYINNNINAEELFCVFETLHREDRIYSFLPDKFQKEAYDFHEWCLYFYKGSHPKTKGIRRIIRRVYHGILTGEPYIDDTIVLKRAKHFLSLLEN